MSVMTLEELGKNFGNKITPLTKIFFISPDLLGDGKIFIYDYRIKLLSVFLQTISTSGFIIEGNKSIFDSLLKVEFQDDNLTDREKEIIKRKHCQEFQSIRIRLEDTGRLISANIINAQNSEEDIIKKIKQKFSQIDIISNKISNCYSLNSINADDFLPLVRLYPKNFDTFNMLFRGILPQTKRVWLFDPYFFIDKPKNKKVLNLILENLSKKEIKLEIHCSNESYGQTQSISNETLKEWQKILNNLFIKYSNVTISIYYWAKNKNFHDRFLITSHIGISSGRGFDIQSQADSTFSILPYDMLDTIKSQFRPKNFDLFAKITKDKISKDFN